MSPEFPKPAWDFKEVGPCIEGRTDHCWHTSEVGSLICCWCVTWKDSPGPPNLHGPHVPKEQPQPEEEGGDTSGEDTA